MLLGAVGCTGAGLVDEAAAAAAAATAAIKPPAPPLVGVGFPPPPPPVVVVPADNTLPFRLVMAPTTEAAVALVFSFSSPPEVMIGNYERYN